MLEQKYRHLYQRWLVDQPAKWLSPVCAPWVITVLAGVLGIVIIPMLALGHPVLATVFLLLSGYCDSLDGTLARHSNLQSDFGSVLDIVTDRLVEFCVVFGLFLVAPETRGLWCMLMLGSILLCVTSFLVVGIFTPDNDNDGKSFHYSPGLMERAEAFVFFILMIWLPGYFAFLALVFSVLVLWTAGVRVRQFYLPLSNNK